MLEKSRKRMVLFIAAVLVLVIGAMLGIIYFTTYTKVKNENKDMLTVFAQSYDENGFPSEQEEEPGSLPGDGTGEDPGMPEEIGEASGQAPAELPGTDGQAPAALPEDDSQAPTDELPGNAGDSHIYEVSTFYAVAFYTDGTVKDYMNDSASGLSDEELVEEAASLSERGSGYGYGDGIVYLISRGQDYTLVTMMDTSVIDDTISTLMRNMIIFGAIAILLLVVLSILLSKWIMKPAAQAYEKQKRFISDAGHELKTPIATISANTEILKQETGDNKWLDNIIYENDRMSVIVKELLDLARLESVKPAMEQVDFSSLCMAAVMPFEAEAFERGLELDYDIEEDISLMGNRGDLEKLVGILTDNAISHCLVPGKVFVSLKKTSVKGKNKALLTAVNKGEALSDEEISNMFERFYRADRARPDEGHYGLGLSIAKAIVSSHDGTIEVRCHDGQVEFTVTLNIQ